MRSAPQEAGVSMTACRLMDKLRDQIHKALPGWTFSHTGNGASEVIKFTGADETLEIHLRPYPKTVKTVDA